MKTRDDANNESALSNVVQVVLESTVNVALGKTVSTNGAVSGGGSVSVVTDGARGSSGYALISVADGPKWVQADLGQTYAISRINVLNDWGGTSGVARTGRDHVVQLSNDPTFATGVTTVFNNDTDNSAGLGAGSDAAYQEPTDGTGKNIVLTTPVNARYVRSWANGHVRVTGGDESGQYPPWSSRCTRIREIRRRRARSRICPRPVRPGSRPICHGPRRAMTARPVRPLPMTSATTRPASRKTTGTMPSS
ncbi:discoidin domain-containing protein [Cohnella rhizosphaerae]|uniref:discoidin domain-containing protein n=1 Tax=Cohnella rhizosphaerae TaxID=1457232 RepID=UPI003B8A79EE